MKKEILEDSVDQITLEEFIKATKPNPGLVASFKVETKDLEPRSQAVWKEAFSAQSKKVYK